MKKHFLPLLVVAGLVSYAAARITNPTSTDKDALCVGELNAETCTDKLGNFVPTLTNNQDLGSTALKWRYIYGDGSQLTNLSTSTFIGTAAGGDLTGTYPNPSLAVDRVRKPGDSMTGGLAIGTSSVVNGYILAVGTAIGNYVLRVTTNNQVAIGIPLDNANTLPNAGFALHIFGAGIASGNGSGIPQTAWVFQNPNSPALSRASTRSKYRVASSTSNFSDMASVSGMIEDLSTNAGSLVLETGIGNVLTQRAVLTSVGNFGVATGSPTTTLDINGNAQFGSGVTKSTFSTTGALSLASGSGLTLSGGGGFISTPQSSVTANMFFGNGAALTNVVGTPAGSDTHIQYNNGGGFAGNANLTYTQSSNSLKFGVTSINLTIVDGNQGTGKLLTSDSSGGATWQAPAAAISSFTYVSPGTLDQQFFKTCIATVSITVSSNNGPIAVVYTGFLESTDATEAIGWSVLVNGAYPVNTSLSTSIGILNSHPISSNVKNNFSAVRILPPQGAGAKNICLTVAHPNSAGAITLRWTTASVSPGNDTSFGAYELK